MSYAGISVREALDRINAPNNGWFLPQVQRQYVWGARTESEDYVCLLLDSLLKRYPIGGIVLWETSARVPYRWFVGEYAPGKYAKQVDPGLWGADKALVYDGQQRLQTLYSVLRHRFNERTLHFDLLFDSTSAESDETGFLFRGEQEEASPRFLRMTELSCMKCSEEEKVDLEDRVLPAAGEDKTAKLRIRKNLSALWDIFVDTNHKSIAYFSVKADNSNEVNEVFRRLNTGGVALTQIELVLSKVKALHSDYEEKLWQLAEKIKEKSGGIDFPSSSILQFFHLLIKSTIRIDEARIDTKEIQLFQDVLINDSDPLVELFSGYLWGLFRINHGSIVPRWLAILPIASYLTTRKRAGKEWRIRAMSEEELLPIHQYFLLSQVCDWNTQTMVNAFAREAVLAAEQGAVFPIEKIREIAIEKSRTGNLNEHQLLGQTWFVTKILMPHRTYIFHANRPQVDHIFPLNLDSADSQYQDVVDVLWNFQPMPAEVNNYKRATHPKTFFNSDVGSKYWDAYDFIPERKSETWDDYAEFVEYRKKLMLDKLNETFHLSITPSKVKMD
ncbi:DUF262 domain-containing protein [Undibacterium sp. Ji50W]|uniref:DUF262 domain-containing protein n=1 Tax=Undibacterium sp. Ji50W TaxID=3413041 RepID=UPI003BF39F77